MRKIGIAIFLSLLLLSVGTVSALQPVSGQPITIPSNSNSFFNIGFYNNQTYSENISFDVGLTKIENEGYFLSIGIKPLSFVLASGESENVLFSFVPNGDISSYPVTINVYYTENNVSSYFNFFAPIVPVYDLIYKISAPASMKPVEPLNFNVSLQNILGQGANVTLSYELNNSNNQKVVASSSQVTLSTLGLDQFSFSLPLNRNLAPGTYNLSISTNYGTEEKAVNYTVIEILPYVSLSKVSSNNINLFGGTYSVTVVNTGNENLSAGNFSLSVSQFNSAFIISKTATVASLAPGQSVTISYTVSYLPIYLIVAIIIIAIFTFFYLNRKLVISKEVVEHKVVGGFVDVKIALKIRNVSKKVLKDLVIVDYVPAHALKVSSIGPKEGKIGRSDNGLSITWREVELQPNDEILLMYEIKSKLGIVGSIGLRSASCSFNSAEGKSYKKKSNSLILNIK